MLTRFIVAVVLLVLSSSLGCTSEPSVAAPSPESAAAPSTQPAAGPVKLTVTVTDIRNHKGQLIFSVFKTKAGFPSTEKNAVNWQIKTIAANTIEFVADLPPGEYGASVLHDEDKNNAMNTNLIGIPSEGYAVTNNPKPRFRAATFKESIFTLPEAGATLTISMQYF